MITPELFLELFIEAIMISVFTIIFMKIKNELIKILSGLGALGFLFLFFVRLSLAFQ